jgi:hypothetical protein
LKNGHLFVWVYDTAAKIRASLEDAGKELNAAPVARELFWIIAKR